MGILREKVFVFQPALIHLVKMIILACCVYSCPPHAISVFVIYIFHLSTELLSAIMNVFLVRGLKQLLSWILVPKKKCQMKTVGALKLMFVLSCPYLYCIVVRKSVYIILSATRENGTIMQTFFLLQPAFR